MTPPVAGAVEATSTSTGGGGGVLLSFAVTIFLLFLGFVNFVKRTAAKYLTNSLRSKVKEVDRTNNISTPRFQDSAVASSMLMAGSEEHPCCAVCGKASSKRCARCKSTRYCSSECQTKHWDQGHKLECKTVNSGSIKRSSFDLSNAFGTRSRKGNQMQACSRNAVKVLPKPKVLFPYETFVELFNWNKHSVPPCGLINCGNSCFANVILQCLMATRPLVAFLLESYHTRSCLRNDWCFLCELCKHVQRVIHSDDPFSPLEILSRIPKMGGNLGYGKQEDANEFMRFAIDSMQSICLDEFGGEKELEPATIATTLIYHIFGGKLQSEVVCMRCNRASHTFDSLMDLCIEIDGAVTSLEDALDMFTGQEWLDGDNKYNCERCNAYVKAWKQLTVYEPPNILTITLKRFKTGSFGKLNKMVKFPETLDLSPYVSGYEMDSHMYKLYAVVVHVDMLNASFFGHYFCYVQDLYGVWYKVDDCKVNKVDLDEVLSQRAYILFYSRISARSQSAFSESPSCASTETTSEGSLHTNSSSSHFSPTSLENGIAQNISSPLEVVQALRYSFNDTVQNMDNKDRTHDSSLQNASVEDNIAVKNIVENQLKASVIVPKHLDLTFNKPEVSVSTDCLDVSLWKTLEKEGRLSSSCFESKACLNSCSSYPVLFEDKNLEITQQISTYLDNEDKVTCSSLTHVAEGSSRLNRTSDSACSVIDLNNCSADSVITEPGESDCQGTHLSAKSSGNELDVFDEVPCVGDATENCSVSGSILEYPSKNHSGISSSDVLENGVTKEEHSIEDLQTCSNFCAEQDENKLHGIQVSSLKSFEKLSNVPSSDSSQLPFPVSMDDTKSSSLISQPQRNLGEAQVDIPPPRATNDNPLEDNQKVNEGKSLNICQNGLLDANNTVSEICKSTFKGSPARTDSSNKVLGYNVGHTTVQPRKIGKDKPIFARGFLNRPSKPLDSRAVCSNNEGNHYPLCDTHLNGSVEHKEENNLAMSDSFQGNFEPNHRPSGNMQSGVAVSSNFDGEVPHFSEATKRKAANSSKELLFTPGFLNRTSRANALKKTELRQSDSFSESSSFSVDRDKCLVSKAGSKDVVPVECNVPDQDTNNLGSECCVLSKVVVPVECNAPDQDTINLGTESCALSNGDVRNAAMTNFSSVSDPRDRLNSHSPVRRQKIPNKSKQGRNERCTCGSQRKWKKCCGRADVNQCRNVSVR